MPDYNKIIESYKNALREYISRTAADFSFDDAIKNIMFIINPSTGSISVYLLSRFTDQLTKQQQIDLIQLLR